jgi:hypothetical protein
MPDFPRIIPTPAQMEALSVSFQRVGRACQVAANQVVEAGAAVHADIAHQRRFFSRYLGKLAAVVEAEQRRQRGPTIGRKRRARRARGRGRADG